MRLLAAALLLLPFYHFGQITIQEPDMSDGGDTAWVSTAVDLSIDFMTTGPNQTWDYSNLVSNGQNLVELFDMSNASIGSLALFGFFAPSKYQATNFASSTDIPLAQISTFLPVSITDVFKFSKNSPDSITSVGFSVVIEGIEVPFQSDTIETRYKFPMNYGDSWYSRGYSNLDMNPIYNGIWRQYRERTSNVDGWGSITTPYGTFDALRVDHLIQESDSIYMEIFGNGTWIPLPIPESHEYEWWTNGQKEPILRITTSDVLGTETVTDIEYRDFLMNTGLNELDQSLKVFPNPTSEFVSINGLNKSYDYRIYSVKGKLVQEGIMSSKIDVSRLDNGNYQLILLGATQNATYSFIKN